MTRVAVATTSKLAADAAAEIADAGGNAVDCAIAASLVAMNTEPGVCALAGGAYVTVWRAGDNPLVIDGNVAATGFGASATEPDVERVRMDYGGGIETLVGAGSIAVPGSLAALSKASAEFGQVKWSTLFTPCVRAARSGFPLSAACHYYLTYSGDLVFGRSEDGHSALHDRDGTLKPAGSNIVVPHLADSLELIAEEGSRALYEGDLASAIVEHCAQNGGSITSQDLRNYEARIRKPLLVHLQNWQVACNPPPAVGGAVLAAMLMAFDACPVDTWDEDSLHKLINVQRRVLSFRKRRLDDSEDIERDISSLLEMSGNGKGLSDWTSSSTVHTSAVDDQGLGCAITASSGYGSGEMPARTGLWMNNALGELELNTRGLSAGPAGARLPSNMAPSVARSNNSILAIGSPGADRITTALHQFLINFVQLGLSLENAIRQPRLHLELLAEGENLAMEPGIEVPGLNTSVTRYPEISMYFGGVGAALFDANSGFELGADPRREGGTCIAGH